MRLLQVCNVGRICGGTAACAWTLMRAFPDWRHDVAFLSVPDAVTVSAFRPATVHAWTSVTDAVVRKLQPDFVLLHNVSSARCERIRCAWTMQYVHSRGSRAAADRTVYCSRWLAEKSDASDSGSRSVLYQAVPQPAACSVHDARALRRHLVVGRLCTPTNAKWPPALIHVYRSLAQSHPRIDWEFVGCPSNLRPALFAACAGRATFFDAGWMARARLWNWDVLLYHHPTLTESFGRTVAEALRAGCVPVVDARGGFCEQLPPGTGFLCESLDAFSEALDRLQDRSVLRNFAGEAQDHGHRAFSLARFRRDVLATLRDAS